MFVTPVVNPTGSPKSVVLVVVDHTDLVEAQERIRESQERLLSIMNHSTSAVSLKDAAGYYEFVNLKFEEVFSVKASDVIGKTDQQLFSRDIALTLRSRELDVRDSFPPSRPSTSSNWAPPPSGWTRSASPFSIAAVLYGPSVSSRMT